MAVVLTGCLETLVARSTQFSRFQPHERHIRPTIVVFCCDRCRTISVAMTESTTWDQSSTELRVTALPGRTKIYQKRETYAGRPAGPTTHKTRDKVAFSSDTVPMYIRQVDEREIGF